MRTLAASIAMAIVMMGTSFSYAQTPAAGDVQPNVLPNNESATTSGAAVADEQWRFVWKDNLWWYYQPDNSWVYWANNQWNKFVPGQPLIPQAYAVAPAPAQVRTYRSYTPRRPRVSVGIGVGSPYGYYGSPYGWGYPYGGGFGRYGYGYPYGGGWGGYGRSGIGFGIGIY